MCVGMCVANATKERTLSNRGSGWYAIISTQHTCTTFATVPSETVAPPERGRV